MLHFFFLLLLLHHHHHHCCLDCHYFDPISRLIRNTLSATADPVRSHPITQLAFPPTQQVLTSKKSQQWLTQAKADITTSKAMAAAEEEEAVASPPHLKAMVSQDTATVHHLPHNKCTRLAEATFHLRILLPVAPKVRWVTATTSLPVPSVHPSTPRTTSTSDLMVV